MCNTRIFLIFSLLCLSACAHHEAIRVECEGALRPINRPPSDGVKVGATNTGADSDRGTSETSHGGR